MKKILSALFLMLSVHLTSLEINTWSTPADTISSTGVNASDPHIAMDGSGNVIAAWLENSLVVSKTKLLNDSWSSLDTLSATGASSPKIVVDPAGNATAVWVESGAVKAATKPFSSSWGTPVTLSASGSSSAQIAIRSNGDVVAVWVASGFINSATKLYNQNWQTTPDTLSAAGADSPQVAVGADGTVIAVWHANNTITSIDNVFAASKPIAGTWSAAATISNPAINSLYPQVAVDPNGNAMALWFRCNHLNSTYSNVVLQSSSLPSSGYSWSNPVDVSSPAARNPADLIARIKYSDSGYAVAAWTTSYDGSTFRIESSEINSNQIWSEPFTIAYDLYAYSIDLAISSVGDIFAVYMSFDTETSSVIIQSRESHAGGIGSGSWTSPVTVSTENENGYPQIAAVVTGDVNNNAVAAWINFDGTNNIIQAVTGTGTQVVPPSNLSITQNVNSFGIFNEYYNLLTWDSSTDPNLVGYAIYRNNVLLAFVESSALEFIDNNQKQNGSVTYGVSATDNSGRESLPIYVSFP